MSKSDYTIVYKRLGTSIREAVYFGHRRTEIDRIIEYAHLLTNIDDKLLSVKELKIVGQKVVAATEKCTISLSYHTLDGAHFAQATGTTL